MAKTFRYSPVRRIGNALIGAGVRLGIPMGGPMLLTTRGRRSGRQHVTPVTPIELNGERFIVSPYGIRDWVLNVRANGQAELRSGREREQVTLDEVDPGGAAPVLKRYLERVPMVAPYFEARAGDPNAAFVTVARRHPVFRIRARASGAPPR